MNRRLPSGSLPREHPLVRIRSGRVGIRRGRLDRAAERSQLGAADVGRVAAAMMTGCPTSPWRSSMMRSCARDCPSNGAASSQRLVSEIDCLAARSDGFVVQVPCDNSHDTIVNRRRRPSSRTSPAGRAIATSMRSSIAVRTGRWCGTVARGSPEQTDRRRCCGGMKVSCGRHSKIDEAVSVTS
jgi:hypothetical protein